VDPVELQQPNVDWRRGGTAGWHAQAEIDPLRPVKLVSSDGAPRPKPAPASRVRAAQTR
jgi:hypothetical protein